MKRSTRDHQVRIATDPVVGCRWLKSSEQHGSIKRPRGPSTARHKRCVTRSICERSAQDDGFVGGLEYNWLNMQETRKDRKSHRLGALHPPGPPVSFPGVENAKKSP